jgi:hypothetical protein
LASVLILVIHRKGNKAEKSAGFVARLADHATKNNSANRNAILIVVCGCWRQGERHPLLVAKLEKRPKHLFVSRCLSVQRFGNSQGIKFLVWHSKGYHNTKDTQGDTAKRVSLTLRATCFLYLTLPVTGGKRSGIRPSLLCLAGRSPGRMVAVAPSEIPQKRYYDCTSRKAWRGTLSAILENVC